MLKKFLIFIVVLFISLNLCGCFATMAMVAQNSKVKQNLPVSYGEALDVVKVAIKTIDIRFEEAVIKGNVACVKGKYSDEKIVQIIISKVSENESLIAVRVGTSQADRKDAEKILKVIIEYSELVIKH